MTYLIGEERHEVGSAGLQDALARSFAARSRPLCLCREPGAPMYVARSPGGFIVKRMPGSAEQHQPWCTSYEAPLELGGRGEVDGTAIQEDVDEGLTRLNLGFALSRGGARKAADHDQESAPSVKAERVKLGLPAMLDYLWEEAGLARWTPGMATRNWAFVHRRLIAAATGKIAKGLDLASRLYLPEPFTPDRKFDIAQARTVYLARVATPTRPGTPRPLMLIVAEVKEFVEGRSDVDIVVKQAPGFRFTAPANTYRRIISRFETTIDGWRAVEGRHLMLVATFSVAPSGVAALEEGALMLTSPEWLPLENSLDAALIAQLVHDDRRFTRTLRYNLPRSRPISVATLVDTRPQATALFVPQPNAPDGVAQARDALVASEADIATWVWDIASTSGPRLPSRSS